MSEANDLFLNWGSVILFVYLLVIVVNYVIFTPRFSVGIKFILQSNRIFIRHPIFILPLLISWLIYAVIVLYLSYFLPWGKINVWQLWLVVLLTIFLFSLIISFSAMIILELIEQLESGKGLNFKSAFFDAFRKDLVRSIPIIVIWSVIWFLLVVIESILSSKKDENKNQKEFNLENAAKTLTGFDQNFSLSGEFFRQINKGVRMAVFLILPAIAWEDFSAIQALKKGYTILKSNILEFFSNFIFSDLAAFVIFLPIGYIFFLSELKATFPPIVWVGVIIYSALAWSYYLYLEQMTSALLYLWYLRWEKKMKEAIKSFQPIPKLSDVEKPSLLDGVYEFKDEENLKNN